MATHFAARPFTARPPTSALTRPSVGGSVPADSDSRDFSPIG